MKKICSNYFSCWEPRVLFWQVAGKTDSESDVTPTPTPAAEAAAEENTHS